MTRILSLDDSHDMHLLLSLILEREGYEHLAALDGNEAWAMLNTGLIDLLILNPILPNVDGWEFCQLMEMNETLRHIPIIVCTSRNDEMIDTAYQSPKMIAGYIIKPFVVSDFLRVVKNALKEHDKPLPTSTEVEYWTNFHTKPIEERLAALRDHNPVIRRRSIWAVNKQDTPGAVEAIIESLNDDNLWVRLAAVRSLAFSQNPQAIEPLQKLVTQVPPEKLKPQNFTKQTLNTPWDVEVSLARWAQWAIKQIEARK